uniref:Rhodopsin domain-containing protein n=2 Tax=Fusarium oxysporum TaxID=5507 RepID=A0A0D2YF03_FUSOF
MFDYVYLEPLPIVEAHLIINSILVGIAVMVVGLRVYSRIFSNARLGLDDAFILVAAPLGVGMLIVQGLFVSAQLLSTNLCSYNLRLYAKLSMGFVSLWTLGNVLQVFLICPSLLQPHTIPQSKGTCGNQVSSFIAIGAFNAITDVLILSLPLPVLWSLQARTSTKVGLTIIFSIGLLVSVVAIIRIISLASVDVKGNVTGTMVWAAFLSTVEPNLAIVCVSLPMLAPLYARLRGRPLLSTKRSRGVPDGISISVPTIGQMGKRKRFSRIVDMDTGDTFALQTIYAPDTTIHNQAVATRAEAEMRSRVTVEDAVSLNGSTRS